ncbi:uncharacterized protein N7479_000680 [Penicillium vulpinum]|uniref:RING-type E3 ubiquitin transferase n=1 Tax=Penicillium vulpinum TaxID=29845 RepID=A0A1V6S6F6_9EURO|nr:uncharacterized protein N7479_000680 [Penicillium vulpinum]KAJ5970762.1 hypothetical protein N7479_000680 [Penicillium vulpinum]OQE09637.1 hypothetical protein PENVUL_c006G06398 [Penicillium vulpinum]
MDDVDLRQEILQRTLQEVADEEKEAANPCVICLDNITEPCVAQPCNHANFDFLCLVSWIEQQPKCPLCKIELTTVKYELNATQGPKLYKVPPPSTTIPVPPVSARSRPGNRYGPRGGRRPLPPPRPQPNDPLERRRNVYRNQTYSMRVGSNRLSQYRELTPEHFNRDEELVSRARKWIRRELRVFSFLNPEPEEEERTSHHVSRPGPQRLENRRANNAEFLLEYVIAILRTVDLKGSAGQAEELLRDFIGRENACLFLHELQAWLRSPYSSLEDWDRNVQYSNTPRSTSDRGYRDSDDSGGRSTPVNIRSRPQRSGRPYRSRSQEAIDRSRRLQQAQQRYNPY